MKRILLVPIILLELGSISLTAPHVSAVTPSIVISQMQPAGAVSGTASEEFIRLTNASSEPADITNWCLQYSSAGSGSVFSRLHCFTPPDSRTKLILPAGSTASLVTNELLVAKPGLVYDGLFNAGLAASGGHVRIIDAASTEIDRLGWGGAIAPETAAAPVHAAGNMYVRSINDTGLVDSDNNAADFSLAPSAFEFAQSGVYEEVVPLDVCSNIEGLQETLPEGYLDDGAGACVLDVCLNIEGLQLVVPEGFYIQEATQCILIPLENSVIVVTELLPNAASYDTGLEYIELHNPHAYPVNLKGYTLLLGPSHTRSYVFGDVLISPGEYLVVSDSLSGLTLPNTSGSIRLKSAAGEIVSETTAYFEPKDDEAWALLDGTWAYTNRPSRAAANLPYVIEAIDDTAITVSVLAPCPAGKYRNPLTNRCRTIETAVASSLLPCDEDEYRNPETNRCRKLAGSNTLAACPEGQERNPETNRCRNVAVLAVTDAATAVTDVAVPVQDAPVNWTVITVAVLFSVVYALYEWRSDVAVRLLKRKILKKP